MSKMPCAEHLTLALRGMGFVGPPESTGKHADASALIPEPKLMVQDSQVRPMYRNPWRIAHQTLVCQVMILLSSHIYTWLVLACAVQKGHV